MNIRKYIQRTKSTGSHESYSTSLGGNNFRFKPEIINLPPYKENDSFIRLISYSFSLSRTQVINFFCK